MNYPALYEFNDDGMEAFVKVFNDELDDTFINPVDTLFVQRIPGTGTFEVTDFQTAKTMASAICDAIGGKDHIAEYLPRNRMWAWLTFVLRDIVFPKGADGRRKFGEVHRWLPSDANDFQKAQRHLVRMPVLLFASIGEAADHLICGRPSMLPEIREQLTSQQDMFHVEFQNAARALYFDGQSKELKRGAGSKTGGSPRRLAQVRRQLDVTWDLFDLSCERLLKILPKEFNRFKTDLRA